MKTTNVPICIDVRDIAPRDRHPLNFSTFRGLDVGDAMELVNDHDPKPLFFQFDAEVAGQFSWNYLERGPQTWHVRIAGWPRRTATGGAVAPAVELDRALH